MSDYTAMKLSDMEASYGGAFIHARASLGASAFGFQVIDMPPNAGEHYPDHNHEADGQEEIYVTLGGSGTLTIDGSEKVALEPETLIRVGPTTNRHVASGDDGLRILVIGGTPGSAYTPASG